ncbi:MAG: response regulator [Endozoicomonas sp.]
MSQGEQTSSGTKFRHGLAVTLFCWFIFLSITPIAIVGITEYREGKKAIIATRYEELSIINLLLSEQINDYFDSIVTNLFIKAGVAQEFLDGLVQSREKLGVGAAEFINSPEYNLVLDEYGSEFVDFLRYYDYSDVILTDADGNIVYTVNSYSDLGQNIFQGELSTTAFSRAVRESFENAEPRYADVGLYPPIGEQYVSFFVLPLVNDRERIIGFLAVQILAYNVQSIFENDHQLGQGLKSYLVGTDAYIRYGTELESSQTMKLKAENPLIENWLGHFDEYSGEYLDEEQAHAHAHGAHDGHDDHSGSNELDDWMPDLDMEFDEDSHGHAEDNVDLLQAHIRSYKNVYGEQVLGIFYPINVAGTPMALISEVSESDAFATVKSFQERLIYLTAVTVILVLLIALLITRRLVRPIRTITDWVNRVAAGDYVQGTVLSGRNEISQLSRSFSEMTEKLRNVISENAKRSWMQDGQVGLNDSMRGEQDISELCRNVVSYLAKYLDMQTGAIYVVNDEKVLQLTASYAWSQRKQSSNRFEFGEGVVGQAALEQQTIELTDIPEDYLTIESGLGSTRPKAIVVMPLVYEKEIKGVFEFALLQKLTSEQILFLELSQEKVAIAINSAQYSERVKQLLEKTTKQSEAMKEQQEELKTVNEELESRAKILEESQEELKAQSEEMQKSNAELEEKTEQLQLQKEEIERKNLDIELSSRTLEEKAKELEMTSKYKSEFLANMSHELRTPLNSLLLLAQMLAENDEGNLTEDQVESAEVIYNGGKELLTLINDILDLSKVEAGKMSINLENIDVEELCTSVKSLFKPLADDRGLDFVVEVEPGTTRSILSDSQRVMQILKNFLSNAFKFTDKGVVFIRIANFTRTRDHGEETYVGFSVKDSGIGIPKEKQNAIFEAFRQADGSTSRKYGGTGLGLAISKEMAGMLGGFIDLESEEGEGTTFTLYLPDNAVCSLSGEKVLADSYSSQVSEGVAVENKASQPKTESESDSVQVEKKTSEPASVAPVLVTGTAILTIEDDDHFTGILCNLAQKNGYQCLHAKTGREGLELARVHRPNAIILDLGLPDMDGNEVLRLLKGGDATRDIPVHIISGSEPDDQTGSDAVGCLVKPVTVADLDSVFSLLGQVISADIRHALLLDNDADSRAYIRSMLEKKGMNVGEAATAEEAEAALADQDWQCIVMEVELPDSSGLDFLQKLEKSRPESMPSIVIHTGKKLSPEEHKELQKYTGAMVLKGDMASERVLDEVSLFIHSIGSDSGEQKPQETDNDGTSIEGHKLLLVDDDLRNTFALSKRLQSLGLEVVIADNGANAIARLEEEDGIELVLMDIMMPVMDGYEATRKIREMDDFRDLPVIALTAKAMSDDKAKCIEAGANDYLTKPVDLDQLVAMIKVWIFQ